MKFWHQVIFWLSILVILTLLFGSGPMGYVDSFYFVCALLPVAIGTSLFFNEILVDRYLLQRRYAKLLLYFVYSMIVSLWAQMMVILFAFVALAELRMDQLDPQVMSVRILALVVYGIVFLQAFVNMFIKLQGESATVASLQSEKEKRERGRLTIRANRKTQQIFFDNILYVESLSDYVRIVQLDQEPVTTRETISKMEKLLPDEFIRVHRSFIVRKDAIQSFTKEEVVLGTETIPIGRKYKQDFIREVEGTLK